MSGEAELIPPAVLDWARRTTGCARVTRVVVRAMPGGAVAAGLLRITVQMNGVPGAPEREVHVVRKPALAHEVAGLRAAQAARPAATAVPELVASGTGEEGPWLVVPLLPGAALRPDRRVPANLFASLARVHAHYREAATGVAEIPRVDGRWWRLLCRGWVLPQLSRHRDRHPAATLARAGALVRRAADHPAAARTLARLPATLVHGDVHRGNVLVDGRRAWLIDWGSCRVGPAMLDLANLAPYDSDEFHRYRRHWQRETGSPLDLAEAKLGYRWAALQTPVQYLPWMAANRPADEVEAALDRAERALAALT